MGLTNLYFICGQIVLLTWLTHTHTDRHTDNRTHAQPHSRPAITLSQLAADSYSRETVGSREKKERGRGRGEQSPRALRATERERAREHTSRLSTGGDVAFAAFFFFLFNFPFRASQHLLAWTTPPPVSLTSSTPATPLVKPSAPRPPTLRH